MTGKSVMALHVAALLRSALPLPLPLFAQCDAVRCGVLYVFTPPVYLTRVLWEGSTTVVYTVVWRNSVV